MYYAQQNMLTFGRKSAFRSQPVRVAVTFVLIVVYRLGCTCFFDTEMFGINLNNDW